MSGGGSTKKGVSQVPKGTEHQPPAVRAKKERRFKAFMAGFSPREQGSAAQRRRRKS